jgi:hypothetical protein
MSKTKFKPGQMVEPIEACSIDVDGVAYTFNRGKTRLRADHPAVQAAPQLFKALEATYPEVEKATAAPGEKRGDKA